MSKTIDAVDIAVLPTGLLTDAKAHMRIDFTDDDLYVKQVVGRAIDYFQRVTEVAVNPTTISWFPVSRDFHCGEAVVPVTPVTSMAVKDADGNDISAAFTLTTNTLFGAPSYKVAGAWQAGIKFTFESGYADATKVPPGIVDCVFTFATHLYEHREIYVHAGPGGESIPAWIMDNFSTWWVPRV
jgi:uncharacterized phiE125 gp8 family phage protein